MMLYNTLKKIILKIVLKNILKNYKLLKKKIYIKLVHFN